MAVILASSEGVSEGGTRGIVPLSAAAILPHHRAGPQCLHPSCSSIVNSESKSFSPSGLPRRFAVSQEAQGAREGGRGKAMKWVTQVTQLWVAAVYAVVSDEICPPTSPRRAKNRAES